MALLVLVAQVVGLVTAEPAVAGVGQVWLRVVGTASENASMVETGHAVDLVLLGATGVTGRQALAHLVRVAPAGLIWAVAGRDIGRLQTALDEVGARVPAIVVDVTDPASVQSMVDRTTVVVNTVGPYADYGDHVYAACASSGVHQVDVGIELDWLRARIVEHHSTCQQTGARIVHSAGFESLPCDLATAVAAERLGEPLATIDVGVTIDRNPPMRSPADVLTPASVRSASGALRRGKPAGPPDVAILCPGADRKRYLSGAYRHSGTGQWLGPMFPSPYLNPAVVRRSAWLDADRGGRSFAAGFEYREGMVSTSEFLPGVGPQMAASISTLAQGWATMISMAPPPVRDLVATGVEAMASLAGSGPDAARLAGWSWSLDVHATAVPGASLDLRLDGRGHPGYRSSANLVVEAGLALVATSPGTPGGVLTPAAAFGTTLVPNLERAGVVLTPG